MNRNEWDELYNYEQDNHLRYNVYPLSGWKFYISGISEDDSNFLRNVFDNIIKKYNLGWKSSKKRFFEVAKGTRKEKIAFFIYLPVDVINKNKHQNLVKELSDVLSRNKYREDFSVSGSKKLANSIYCRYELNIPFREEGFNKEDYIRHRKKSNDNFNLESNLDFFDLN